MEVIKANFVQKRLEQQKENNGTPVQITSPSRKRQKYNKSRHENFKFDELIEKAKERAKINAILEKN